MFDPDRMLGQSVLAMRNGEMASGVMIALAKVGAGRALSNIDTNYLNEGVEFLNSVLEGYEWFDSPAVTSQSRSNAFSFETAASFWKFSVLRADIKDELKKMKDLLSQLQDKENNDDNQLENIRLFFGKILEESVEHFGYLPPHDPMQQLF